MAIQVQGNGGVVAEVDGTGFRALRVTLRPTEYGSLGEYQAGGVTGTLAAPIGTNSELAQFRWTDATRLALVKKVILDGFSGSATAFTAGFASVQAFIARSFTAAGTGGGALTMTGNNAKLRTSMGTSLVGEIRIATTAALGAGTKTLDANPIGSAAFAIGTTASVNYLGRTPLFGDIAEGIPHPVVLAQNEGIVVRATAPATGTAQAGFTFGWAEVAAY